MRARKLLALLRLHVAPPSTPPGGSLNPVSLEPSRGSPVSKDVGRECRGAGADAPPEGTAAVVVGSGKGRKRLLPFEEPPTFTTTATDTRETSMTKPASTCVERVRIRNGTRGQGQGDRFHEWSSRRVRVIERTAQSVSS